MNYELLKETEHAYRKSYTVYYKELDLWETRAEDIAKFFNRYHKVLRYVTAKTGNYYELYDFSYNPSYVHTEIEILETENSIKITLIDDDGEIVNMFIIPVEHFILDNWADNLANIIIELQEIKDKECEISEQTQNKLAKKKLTEKLKQLEKEAELIRAEIASI